MSGIGIAASIFLDPLSVAGVDDVVLQPTGGAEQLAMVSASSAAKAV